MGIPFRLLITLLFTYVLSPPTLQVKDPSKGQGYCAPSSQSCSELPISGYLTRCCLRQPVPLDFGSLGIGERRGPNPLRKPS